MFLFLFTENTEIEGVHQDKEQRIDLIKFYNTIFVQVVKDNALKYSTNTVVSYPILLNTINKYFIIFYNF